MNFIVAAAGVIVIATIGAGFALSSSTGGKRPALKGALGVNLLAFVPLLVGALVVFGSEAAAAAARTNAADGGSGLGFIAAALSTGLATIGAGYAVAAVASSALGAVSEDQSLLGKTLIFVGLAEGIAIYGLITSIMILGAL